MTTLRTKRETQRQIAVEMRDQVAAVSYRLDTEFASLGTLNSGFGTQTEDVRREIARARSALDHLVNRIASTVDAIEQKGG